MVPEKYQDAIRRSQVEPPLASAVLSALAEPVVPAAPPAPAAEARLPEHDYGTRGHYAAAIDLWNGKNAAREELHEVDGRGSSSASRQPRLLDRVARAQRARAAALGRGNEVPDWRARRHAADAAQNK